MRAEPLAYHNGQFIPLSRAAISVFDGGFMQGTTVAEQLRTFNGKLFRLDLHLSRLAHSLMLIGIDLPMPLEKLGHIATELAEQNRKLLDPADDQGVTIFITPGPYGAYAEVALHKGPTIGVHTQPLPFSQWADKYQQGQSLIISEVRQVPSSCWPPELKCRSRMHYYLADKQAREQEPAARALLRDERGFVTEASTANILVYYAGQGLVSPSKERILPGVTLAVLEELAEKMRIPFSHRDLAPEDVARADEVLLCSTSPCILPVTTLNGQPIADGHPGPIAARLRHAWNQMVGLDIQAQAQRFAHR